MLRLKSFFQALLLGRGDAHVLGSHARHSDLVAIYENHLACDTDFYCLRPQSGFTSLSLADIETVALEDLRRTLKAQVQTN